MALGDADRRPDGALLERPWRHDLEVPDLVLVADGEALTSVDVAVLLRQGAHYLDGLAGGLGPLQAEDL